MINVVFVSMCFLCSSAMMEPNMMGLLPFPHIHPSSSNNLMSESADICESVVIIFRYIEKLIVILSQTN